MPISVDEEYRSKGGPGGRLPVIIWQPDGLPSDAKWAGKLRPGSLILTSNDGQGLGQHLWRVDKNGTAQPAGPPPPTLSDGAKAALAAWWPLDEAADGPRVDAHNGQDLTQTNVVSVWPGIQENAVTHGPGAGTYSGGFLNRTIVGTDPIADLRAVPFTLAFWFRLDPGRENTTGMNGPGMKSWSYRHWGAVINFPGAGSVSFGVGTYRTWNEVEARGDWTPDNNWHFFVGTWDPSISEATVQLDLGTVYASPPSTWLATGNGQYFQPSGWDLTAYRNPLQGQVDEVAVFANYHLSKLDRFALYNDGAGVSYAEAMN